MPERNETANSTVHFMVKVDTGIGHGSKRVIGPGSGLSRFRPLKPAPLGSSNGSNVVLCALNRSSAVSGILNWVSLPGWQQEH